MKILLVVAGFWIFLLPPFSRPAMAQSTTKDAFTLPASFDPEYIADYTDLLTSRLYWLYQDASFVLNPKELDKLVYKPNVNARIGIAAFYKWFGLGLSIGNPFYHRSYDTYGKTQTIDLRVNAFGRSVAAELFLQNYKGFYIQNHQPENGSYYQIPSMNVFSIGMAGYWIQNYLRYSIRAAYTQNERQRKSAGSFMIRPSLVYYKVSSDDGIIPPDILTQNIYPDEHLTGGEFLSIGLAPGYSYSFVFARYFYLNAGFYPAFFWQHYTYSTRERNFNRSHLAFKADLRVAAGYNSDRWFLGAGLGTGFNQVAIDLADAPFFYDVAQLRFWGGTRFDLFKKKKKKK
jgi:hypothetical protein